MWKSFSSYLNTLFVMGMFLLVVTYFGAEKIWFNVLFGTLSSGIEVSSFALITLTLALDYECRLFWVCLSFGSISPVGTRPDWLCRSFLCGSSEISTRCRTTSRRGVRPSWSSAPSSSAPLISPSYPNSGSTARRIRRLQRKSQPWRKKKPKSKVRILTRQRFS